MDRPTEQPQNGSSLLKDKSTSPGLTVALWNRLKRLWRRYVLHRDRSRILELMFRAHVRRTMVFRVQTLLVAFAFLVLAMWPSDYWLFENPKVLSVFTFWRLTTVLTVVGIYVGISWLDPVRSRTIWTLILVLVGYSALTGYLFGEVRGLSFPWFYMAYMLPVFTVAVSLDFFQRLMAGFVVPAGYVAAYMYNVPGALQYPGLDQFIPLVASSVILFSIIGHTIYHLDRVNFFQSRVVKRQRQTVRELARRDQLTDLWNRHEFMNRFGSELTRARRYGHPLAVMMIDVDRFKRVNDRYGHQVGDDVLRRTGEILAATTRDADIPGRYGGEEFVVALPETSVNGARRIAERLRRALQEKTFAPDGEAAFTVTCSVGLAEAKRAEDSPESLLKRADRALYRAKEAGRNRVEVLDEKT